MNDRFIELAFLGIVEWVEEPCFLSWQRFKARLDVPDQ